MYLGKDYRYYNTLEPALPNYLRIQMEKSNVVMDAMKGWALSDYQIDEGSAKVIDMISPCVHSNAHTKWKNWR